jgi:hypothetical protein
VDDIGPPSITGEFEQDDFDTIRTGGGQRFGKVARESKAVEVAPNVKVQHLARGNRPAARAGRGGRGGVLCGLSERG